MLVYLATYPRSGNSLVQRIVAQGLWRLPAVVKAGAGRPLPRLQDWELRAPADGDDGAPAVTDRLRDRLVVYRRAADGEPRRWGLQAIPQDLLGEADRRALAAHDEVFVLKTHHPPLDGYLPGERVVQVLRHPGPSLLSYYRLLRAQAERSGHGGAPSFEEVIAGAAQFGCWSHYNRVWAHARRALGDRCLVLRYDEVARDQDAARGALSAFLGLAVKSHARVDFEAYARKHAAAGVRGRDEGYERFYAPRQLERLWSQHGPTAEGLGFAPPSFVAAARSPQAGHSGPLRRGLGRALMG